MDDKTLMENLLITVKATSGLLYHGTIESSTGNVRTAFDNVLSKTMCIQKDIYSKMSEKGWYQTAPVEQQKITQTAQKFSQMQ
jgi:spore coat protein CotF